MTKQLVLGTRGSALALWQARHVRQLLRERGVACELEIIHTEGDLQQSAPLTGSDVGVFVRRIEHALLSERIDFAVHSLKDLPTTQPDGLTIAAVPRRHDPRDAVLTMDGADLDGLPSGAVVGTGSPRRRMQLLHARPDLKVEPLRGNVDTRVSRVREGRFDAVILALAGIERLQIDSVEARPIPVERCLPAVGQGALAIETRAADRDTRGLLEALNHEPSAIEVRAERACLRRLGGGCLAPATAHARLNDARLELAAVVGELDGTRMLAESETCGIDDAEAAAVRIAERLIASGAEALLERARQPG